MVVRPPRERPTLWRAEPPPPFSAPRRRADGRARWGCRPSAADRADRRAPTRRPRSAPPGSPPTAPPASSAGTGGGPRTTWPHASGRSRHAEPVRATQNTPSSTPRWSPPAPALRRPHPVPERLEDRPPGIRHQTARHAHPPAHKAEDHAPETSGTPSPIRPNTTVASVFGAADGGGRRAAAAWWRRRHRDQAQTKAGWSRACRMSWAIRRRGSGVVRGSPEAGLMRPRRPGSFRPLRKRRAVADRRRAWRGGRRRP